MSRRAPAVQRGATRGLVAVELWRIALPVLWFGMVAAISFIEAPLKFQAPGITIPLGLGIGRLVFAALNVAEGLVLLALTLLSFWPSAARISGGRLGVWAALAVVYVAKIVFVRPPLNARTDLVLQGEAPGQSIWHYVYIACDVATMILLVLAALGAARALLPAREQPARGTDARRA
ncbi:hypothetical protein [Leucobacter luti]|uniref:Uncharacterized protein n=1 Tax=Leucobacter luti TaxID=340320 RepID=A0A4Q7U6U8_9MICO|nr:hypothetical protein [Leucobacter luti]MBL3700545.1 hypothetical protein [Leucobacter luti]RZT68620.1 hypothetical protein EV139_0346 [Leucobacter luti]